MFVEEAPGVREVLELVEQHGLPDATQPGEQLAATVTPEEETLQRDVHGVELAVTADQGRRPRARPGAVGIPHRIHPATVPNYIHD